MTTEDQGAKQQLSPPPTLVRALDLDDATVDVGEIAVWMLDAGQPFLGWLLGEDADAIVRGWVLRSNSEFARRHTVLLLDKGHCVGGIAALGGADLSRARISDMQALLRMTAEDDRGTLAGRLRTSRAWFLPVSADEFYISKISVAPSHRGLGLGKVLVHDAVDRATDNAFRGVRLDVAATNLEAIGLYRSFGFEPIGERYLEELATVYVAMRMELPKA